MPDLRSFQPDERELVRAAFEKRIHTAQTAAWRDFWTATLMLLEGNTSEGLQKLRYLTESTDQELASHAFMAIGQHFEEVADLTSAESAYAAAQRTAEDSDELRFLVHIARVRNSAGRFVDAARLFDEVDLKVRLIPEDIVQFIMVEYGRALLASGRLEEASRTLALLVDRFPERQELTLIRSHVLGLE